MGGAAGSAAGAISPAARVRARPPPRSCRAIVASLRGIDERSHDALDLDPVAIRALRDHDPQLTTGGIGGDRDPRHREAQRSDQRPRASGTRRPMTAQRCDLRSPASPGPARVHRRSPGLAAHSQYARERATMPADVAGDGEDGPATFHPGIRRPSIGLTSQVPRRCPVMPRVRSRGPQLIPSSRGTCRNRDLGALPTTSATPRWR